MTKQTIQFEIEKETKNSVRHKEVPAEGRAPVVGSLYVQKWFAGKSRFLEVTIEKDWSDHTGPAGLSRPVPLQLTLSGHLNV